MTAVALTQALYGSGGPSASYPALHQRMVSLYKLRYFLFFFLGSRSSCGRNRKKLTLFPPPPPLPLSSQTLNSTRTTGTQRLRR